MTLKVLRLVDVRGWQWTFYVFLDPDLPQPDEPGITFEFRFPLIDAAHAPVPPQLWVA